MQSEHINPLEDIDSRPSYSPDSEEFALMRDFLFSELRENTTIYYCLKDHSIETRTTKKYQQNPDCLLKTRMQILCNPKNLVMI